MFLNPIQAELIRLQLHPVNLGVSAKDDRLIALRGSLLQYWKLPAVVDGKWFLDILRSLPDAAGPEVVMNALSAAQASEAELASASESRIAQGQPQATEAGKLNG